MKNFYKNIQNFFLIMVLLAAGIAVMLLVPIFAIILIAAFIGLIIYLCIMPNKDIKNRR